MDLKALIAKSLANNPNFTVLDTPAKVEKFVDEVKPILGLHAEIGGRPPEAINQTVPDNPICSDPSCKHPYDAHEEGQECNILECACQGFMHPVPSTPFDAPDSGKPTEPTFNLKNASIPPKEPVVPKCPNCDERPCPTPDVCAQDIAEAKAKKTGKMTFTIPANTLSKTGQCEVTPPVEIVVTDPQPIDLDADTLLNDPTKCRHLCENPLCKKWWTHGDKDKCRYPDLINQGMCLSCLNGGLNPDPTADFVDGKFTVAAEVKIRNRERTIVCKDMNVEQLTRHIALLAKEIEKLRIQSLETRKMRAEAEEAELENVPEEEREKFIQALRNGNKKSERKPRASKKKDDVESTPGVRLSAYEKNVQNIMRRLNLTREQAEAFIND